MGGLAIHRTRYSVEAMSAIFNPSMLLELNNIEETLRNHGFLIKRIISNGLWYHKKKNLLKDNLTPPMDLFTADEVSETTFGHEYNWQDDTLRLNLSLNVHPKSRATGPDLDQTDISGVKVTKTVLARLTGQCY